MDIFQTVCILLTWYRSKKIQNRLKFVHQSLFFFLIIKDVCCTFIQTWKKERSKTAQVNHEKLQITMTNDLCPCKLLSANVCLGLWSTNLFCDAPFHAGSLVSCAQNGAHVHFHAHALSPCVFLQGGSPGPGMDSSHSFELCLCPCLDPSPVSLGWDLLGLSHHPQVWPRVAGACERAAQLQPWHPGHRALCGSCYIRGPVELASGTVGHCCHLLRSAPASSCHEEPHAQRCMTVPGWQTAATYSRREPLSVQHNTTYWEEKIFLSAAHNLFCGVCRFDQIFHRSYVEDLYILKNNSFWVSNTSCLSFSTLFYYIICIICIFCIYPE